MKSFNEICREMGYTRGDSCPIPVLREFFAYSNGVATKFQTEAEARKSSKLVEVVDCSAEARKKWWAARMELEAKAAAIWFTALKEHWTTPCQALSFGLSEELFQVCYDEAYARGHANGYDEVENYMREIVDFALKIRAAK
jgi:hypothetical protein